MGHTPAERHLIPRPLPPYASLRMVWRALRGRPLVLSYPKSGRTWLRVMLDELGVDAQFTHYEAPLRQHLHFAELGPNPLWCSGRPTLLLLRDPLDTLVSCYFQATKRLRIFDGSFDAFARDPRYGLEKLARWNTLWAAIAEQHPRVRVASYEQLHADTRAVLAALVRHFGGDATDGALARAIAAGDIDAMRAKERAGDYGATYQERLTPGDRSDPESYKVRRGAVGGYRETMSDDDVRWAEGVLAKYGYREAVAGALARAGLARS